jgi:hypothetical protein
MSSKYSMDDYIDVAERISKFIEKYPEGSLQTVDWKVEMVGERTFIVYRAAAYRFPSDKRPGHGTAWEPFPGPTPYTKDSELMNAETAAWGRACVAIGILANRKIASRQEVKARQGAEVQPPGEIVIYPPQTPDLLDDASVNDVLKSIKDAGVDQEWVRRQLVATGAKNVPEGNLKRSTLQHLNPAQAVEFVLACAAVGGSE